MAATAKQQALAQIWRETHRDYKGMIDGKRTIMIYRQGTRLVLLDNLTEAEIADRVKGYVPAEASQ